MKSKAVRRVAIGLSILIGRAGVKLRLAQLEPGEG